MECRKARRAQGRQCQHAGGPVQDQDRPAAGLTSSAFLSALAKHYGLDERRLQAVNLPPPEQMASLTSNNVQGLLCWEPWPHRAVATGSTKVVHSGLTSYFQANNNQSVKVSANRSVFAVSQEFARRSPNAVRAALGALLRAQRYVANPANTDEVQKMFAEFQKQDIELVRAIWGNYVFNPAFDDAYGADMGSTAGYPRSRRPDQTGRTLSGPLPRHSPARGTGTIRLVKRSEGRWKP
ncbi:MAG: ABC transporter substrate-binding protein [Betaproteobacteria bacterium]|nr:ABC transporter substrate-binding protein [Betaproteobacteria bacterium]